MIRCSETLKGNTMIYFKENLLRSKIMGSKNKRKSPKNKQMTIKMVHKLPKTNLIP